MAFRLLINRKMPKNTRKKFKNLNKKQSILALNRKSSGFTMIEMVAVIFLIAIITALVTTMLTSSLKNYRNKKQAVDLEEKAASVMREFEKSARAATSITTSGANELVFYRYYDLTSSSPTKVRYFIDGNQFKVGQTQPQGTPPSVTYPSTNEVITLVVADVTNSTQLFNYYDGNNNLLSGNFDPANVRLIKLTISLDKNGSAPPAPVTETTEISLRNMKNNL